MTGGAGDEAGLVGRLRAGEEAAYEEMVRNYGGRMLAVARRLARNEEDARDIVQDAFVQAFRRLETFKGESSLGTWLHRVTVNAGLMRLRAKKSRPLASIEELLPRYKEDGHRAIPEAPWKSAGDASAERAETRGIVREAIDQLPEDYRNVLLLRDVEQLDTRETADALGVAVGVVKTRLHRARQALRGLLESRYGLGAI